MNVLRGIASVVCLVVVLGNHVEAADSPKPKDGPLGMKFVPLPKGTTYLGWNGAKGSAKKTEIREDFEIAIHTVTQGQWTELMGKNPSGFSRNGKGKGAVKDIKDEELKHFPVESVSWDDCQEFVKMMNEKEKGYVYRLPTEQEWEYACRGGATSEVECSYHFYFDKPTNDISSAQAIYNGDKVPFLGRPERVGSYPPNKLGLCDMHGNVWQWTSTADGALSRVCRGGGWNLFGKPYQASYRFAAPASSRGDDLGFRLARVPSAPGK